MGFGLQLSSVNFGTSRLSNVEQLAGLDHHFSHLKGVAVFCNSMFLLCSDTFMVMSSHILVTVIDSFQLSLHPETAFVQSTGSPDPLLILLVSSFYRHLVCVLSTRCSLQRLCLGQSHPHLPWMPLCPRRTDPQYSSNSWPQSHLLDQQWPWLDWRGD